MNKSTVSVKKISVYEFAAVETAVRSLLEPLGGISNFVQPGQRVLIKPNLLSGFAPEAAVTTHPSLVRAVVVLVKEAGGLPCLGDSPGYGELRSVLRRTGIAEAIDGLGVEIADFKNTSKFEAPENRLAKKISLAKAITDTEVIISLPKLKTHSQMNFTGALKNQYGLVVGHEKAHYHYRMKNRDWLALLIVEINKIAKPSLAIMDGIVAMEGLGPSGGEPRQVGALIAGSDLTAVDVLACNLICLDPRDVPLLEAARKIGYGTTDLSSIDVVGDPWKELIVQDFKKVPELSNILRLIPMPSWLMSFIRKIWAPKPRIIADRCIQCLACYKGCPITPPAIDPRAFPQVDDDRCIRCYCCHEFCPEKAIELRRVSFPWVRR